MAHHLAQVNYGRLSAPLDDPPLADFVAALDPVNATAEEAPGFAWRLRTEDGDAGFGYGRMHREYLRRRREWFERVAEPTAACWWSPAGHTPSTDEAEERIRHLRAHGPTSHAFTLRQHYPAPDPGLPDVPVAGSLEWLCPA